MPNKQPKLPDEVWIKTLAKQISGAAVACVIDGKVLIVKANYKDYWTFPGGVVDEGEAPLRAAVRELYEETGLKVDVGRLNFRHVSVTNKFGLKSYNFVFETQVSTEILQDLHLQVEEIEDYQLLTKEQILSGECGVMASQLILWAENKTGYYEVEK